MKRICAWCGKDKGDIDVADRENETSHGICVECKDAQLAELRKLREAK